MRTCLQPITKAGSVLARLVKFLDRLSFELLFQKQFCMVRTVRHPALQSSREKAKRACLKHSLWICLLFFAAVTGSALEIQQAKWGFDGQVVWGRFNLLSVLVENPSTAPFDGTVNLYKARGLEQRVGALYASPCYVSPKMSRWVQFYLYVDNPYDEWRMEWGRAPEDHHDITAPKQGPPAQVLLSDSTTLLNAASAFKQFPDELFPPTVAATSGLDSVLLDHTPRWEPAKRQAFLEWLRAGGKVHLLENANGRSPIFSDELSVLNSPLPQLRIGAGLVVRHNATASQIQKQDLGEEKVSQPPSKPKESAQPLQTSDFFLGALSRLSRAHHNWGVIYLLTLAYLAIVGPGNLIAGRRLTDYRLRIGLLLATIGGFALLFHLVGRGGQREASVVHTLSYARSINGDSYNVTQWINVFATRGAHYTITHGAPHNLYATGQEHEPVNGWIQNGRDGRFFVDIPMFSRRAFLHQAVMKGANIPVQMESATGAGASDKFKLMIGADFRKQIVESWVVKGDRLFALQLNDDRLEVAGEEPLDALLSANNALQPFYMYSSEDEAIDVNGEFRKLVRPLIAWSLGAAEKKSGQIASFRPTDDGVQLFIFARSPESFGIAGQQFGRETGYVLYHLDLETPVRERKP
jgi:hypothetical protein